MGDNVHEWCSDWWTPDYYASSPVDNPVGHRAGSAELHVAAPGGIIGEVQRARRPQLSPARPRYNDYGFRVYADAY